MEIYQNPKLILYSILSTKYSSELFVDKVNNKWKETA